MSTPASFELSSGIWIAASSSFMLVEVLAALLSCTASSALVSALASSSIEKIFSPLRYMSALSGISKKLIQRSSVVLPLPEEPIIASTCPSSSSKSMPFNTLLDPKFLYTSFTLKNAISHLTPYNNSFSFPAI